MYGAIEMYPSLFTSTPCLLACVRGCGVAGRRLERASRPPVSRVWGSQGLVRRVPRQREQQPWADAYEQREEAETETETETETEGLMDTVGEQWEERERETGLPVHSRRDHMAQSRLAHSPRL